MTQRDLGIWFANECKLSSPLSQSSIGTMLKRRQEVEQRPAIQRYSKRPHTVDAPTSEVEELFAAPRTTIVQVGTKAEGEKLDKSRITVGVVANGDGSHRIDPIFIASIRAPDVLPVRLLVSDILATQKGWMTSEIFNQVVKIIDRAAGAKQQGKKCVLLLDNASPHNRLPNLENLAIIKLPPNTTSKLQPLDAGIIAAYKKRYRSRQYKDAAKKFQ
ncbi:hypothetical protein [Absidia glauca]|uniref:DDE-1 domain-containing protein n=1 Tax=Absidia glauca TaxID=4829 RepID=A0A163K620_ABSGL|nr:hypothetical protein [Absidia glauca]